MAKQHVTISFENQFSGELTSLRGKVAIGRRENGMAPYDLLLGALGSCLYATFLDVIEKKKLSFDQVTIDLEGEKRETIPMTLSYVHVVFEIQGANLEKKAQYEKSLDLATKYCSVYETISKVADMKASLKFL